MTKLLNIAKLLMIKTVSELGSWSFRQFIKCKFINRKKKKETIPCHLFPFCQIPIFKHLSTGIIGKRERETLNCLRAINFEKERRKQNKKERNEIVFSSAKRPARKLSATKQSKWKYYPSLPIHYHVKISNGKLVLPDTFF